MTERRFFPSVCLQFSFGCTLCTLVYLMTLNGGEVCGYFPLVLLPYSPGIFVANWVFLKHERTVRDVVLFNACIGGGAFAAVFLIDGWCGVALAVFSGLFFAWSTVRGANSAFRQPGLHSQILILDTSALLLVLFTGFLAIMDLPTYWGFPITAGFAAAVLGVITMRMNRSMGAREWTFIGLAFVCLILLGWILMNTVAAPAGQGLVAVWSAGVAVVRMFGRALWAFLVFLGSLMKPADYGEMEPFEPIKIPGVEEPLLETNPMVTVVLAVLGIVLLAAFAVWGLYLLGKVKIGGKGQSRTESGVIRKKFSLWQALCRLFERFRKSVSRHIFLYRNRDNPIGLYYILVRKCRFGLWHKRISETPREFLERLSEYAREDLTLKEALLRLIPAVDMAFYAPKKQGIDRIPQSKLIRSRINTVVRRQYVRIMLENFRSALKRRQKTETVGGV